MLKDIEKQVMTNFGVAMVPTDKGFEEEGQTWECYLVNTKDVPVHGVFITSKGYSHQNGEPILSSTLRYFHEVIAAKDAVLLELIPPNLTSLTREFFISFRENNYVFEKKFLFVEGSLSLEFLTTVPVLNRSGVWIC